MEHDFLAEVERIRAGAMAFRARYLRFRFRQSLVQKISTALCLALVFDAVINDSFARAVLAALAVLAIGFFPLLPKDPRLLIEGIPTEAPPVKAEIKPAHLEKEMTEENTEPMTEDGFTKLRAMKIAILAQHVSEMLVASMYGNCDCPEHQAGAEKDATLDWLDAVYAAGMAARTLALVQQIKAEQGGSPATQDELVALARERMLKAMEDQRLGVLKFSSRAEYDAFTAQAKNHGGH